MLVLGSLNFAWTLIAYRLGFPFPSPPHTDMYVQYILCLSDYSLSRQSDTAQGVAFQNLITEWAAGIATAQMPISPSLPVRAAGEPNSSHRLEDWASEGGAGRDWERGRNPLKTHLPTARWHSRNNSRWRGEVSGWTSGPLLCMCQF